MIDDIKIVSNMMGDSGTVAVARALEVNSTIKKIDISIL